VDPKVDRIAPQYSRGVVWRTRGGFMVRREGDPRPVAIGSMGDGMWRMLALAITLSQCKGGCLLIDEIDTGLHHSVLEEMWKMVYGAAKDLDVQVFATTHSNECGRSLAAICSAEPDRAHRVALHRIDKDSSKSVAYDEAEIVAISKNPDIEFR
jgi:hypothetical protein